MSFDLGLTGQRALVTGGTKGVGAAVVAAFRDAGVRVITTARVPPERPIEGVRFIAADVSTSSGCVAVAEEVKRQAGGVDIIVNVVGGSTAPPGGFAALGDAEWAKALDQNLMSAVRLGSCPSSGNVGTKQRSHHPRYVDSGAASTPRIDYGVCCCQGRPVDIQQEPVEGGFAQGGSSPPRSARMGRD